MAQFSKDPAAFIIVENIRRVWLRYDVIIYYYDVIDDVTGVSSRGMNENIQLLLQHIV